tara:strand:- start:82 stop:324 length:243 start_codon:yes stop_codon:yes gene_type:complete
MGRNPITFILGAIVLVFVAAMGFFYLQEGSFEGAGARMDTTMSELADETGDALDRAGDATEDVINDITEDEATTEDVTNN